MPTDETSKSAPRRIESMDQLRGYAIAGMILVNYLGDFEKMPWTLKHHRLGMSYADTIAPLFMFVVGMGFRLSFMRRVEREGPWRARWDALKRYLAIAAVGAVFAGTRWPAEPMPFWRQLLQATGGWWDALIDIGLAGVLSIPFMNLSTRARALAAFVYVALFQAIFIFAGYGDWCLGYFDANGAWVNGNSFNGGPLGPVSYAFVLLIGTIAYDLLATGDRRRILKEGLAWGIALSALGYALKLPWGGFKAEWPFTQYGMSAPYPIYSTGLAFFAFLFFYLLCDVFGRRIPTLTILGENALVMYILHSVIADSNKDFISRDAPPLRALGAFALLYGCCYAVARKLHKDGIIVKL